MASYTWLFNILLIYSLSPLIPKADPGLLDFPPTSRPKLRRCTLQKSTASGETKPVQLDQCSGLQNGGYITDFTKK
jgi:hypothetical protein